MKLLVVMNWILLGTGIVFNTLATVLVKVATQGPFKLPSLADPISVIKNWPLILAVGCFGCGLLFYASAVSRLPLSVVSPIFASGTIALVAALSFVLFKEPMRLTTVIGIGQVILGVILITRL